MFGEMKYTCSVNYLLERNAAHSGWLKKIKDGPFGKSSKRRYAVIHEGLFYLFEDDESVSTNEVIPLTHYKLKILERTSAVAKWGFSLEKIESNGEANDTINFTVGSEREHKDWIQVFENWKLASPDQNNSENEYISALSDGRNSVSPDIEKLIISDKPSKQCRGGRERMPLPSEIVPESPNLRRHYEVTEKACSNSLNRKPVPLPPPKPKIQTPESEDYYADPDMEIQRDFASEYLPPTVFKWNLDRNGAKKLLDDYGTPGVYIIRKGKDKGDVISAFLLGDTRHYKIFVEEDEMYLKSDHPRFRKHVDLIMYYHLNNLPTCHARLETPYS